MELIHRIAQLPLLAPLALLERDGVDGMEVFGRQLVATVVLGVVVAAMTELLPLVGRALGDGIAIRHGADEQERRDAAVVEGGLVGGREE